VKDGPEQGMKKPMTNFLNDDSGATAIEYALIAAGIAFAILTAVNSVGTNFSSTMANIISSMP
jgi:pilus assembly protein Flp/PilA